MIGALWTGISGLASQQTALDNESHNIANVNTVGFKASRISFADQIYQDKIGKGSKILDAEKLYEQGNLKLTGVAYDMALSGDGFFAVADKSSSGTSETYYTRAGNFRMGDNGTLQDSQGNEVQGWAMSPIDAKKDVTSTNPDNSAFTNDYNKLLSSKVIKHSTYIETITAKATNYADTAVADAEVIFGGAGLKAQATKVADVEALVSNYNSWLSKLQAEPDGLSATSTGQVSQINFKGDAFRKEGDQIYVYVDGNKVAQNFISETASTSKLTAGMVGDLTGNGVIDADDANLAASRIATYKALADKISKIPGFEASTITNGTAYDATDPYANSFAGPNTDVFTKSTKDLDVLHGMIEIKSMIPGVEFVIKEHAEVSGTQVTQGTLNASGSETKAVMGQGVGALESSRQALIDAVVGKQRDVYTSTEFAAFGTNTVSYQISIFDKDLAKNVTVPATALTMHPGSMDDMAYTINNNADLNTHVKAEIINGNLVVTTKDSNSDVEFSGTFMSTAATAGVASTTSTADADILSASASDTTTAGLALAEALTLNFNVNGTAKTITLPVDATPRTLASSVGELQTQLNSTGLSHLTVSSSGNDLVITGPAGITVTGFTISDTSATTTTAVNTTATAATSNADIVTTPLTLTNAMTVSVNINGIVQQVSIDADTARTTGAGVATAINAALKANGLNDITASFASPDIVFSATGGNSMATTVTSASITEYTPGIPNSVVDKSADYSIREGAGGEFIEIINTIDQTNTQDSLQLRLDTLDISDSAFGEFSVDSTGLITMKQDGAEFAIGQVAIALFNSSRGLDPVGNNLLSKTNESGEAIYNINNDKAASIEAKSLELSTADLSESLVNLMVFQRAFEANAKSITTSDQLLTTLIQLKR